MHAASKAVIRPDGPHLFIRRELAALRRRHRRGNGGPLFVGQDDGLYLVIGKAQQDAGEVVLRFGRESADALDGLIQKLGHVGIMHMNSLQQNGG